MASVNKTSTQVRKTISFSKKRDKELLKFVDDNEDDFSFNAKQLMLDGLRLRQMLEQNNQNAMSITLQSMQNSNIGFQNEIQELPKTEKRNDNKRASEPSWDDLEEVELEENKVNEDELEKNLDRF